MRTVPAGTTTTDALAYTSEQCRALFGVASHVDEGTALPNMLQPDIEFGAARPEFVNHVLCPDGTLLATADDVLANAKERAQLLLAAGDVTKPDTIEAVSGATRQIAAIAAHLAERRFLLIVDAELNPRIWFQCATPMNPDVYPQPEA